MFKRNKINKHLWRKRLWRKRLWRLWARALGEKVGGKEEADKVAFIRTMIIIQAVVTNVLIAINIIINWLK